MSDIDTFAPLQTPPSKSEFAYQTSLVIYNFLHLVPLSPTLSPTDEVVDAADVESPATFTPLSSHNRVSSGHEEADEKGAGDACGSGNTENDGKSGDRQDMFDELKATVTERNQQKEADVHESTQRASQTRKMLQEFMAKVQERDVCIASSSDSPGALLPAVTIIKKNNTMKYVVDPATPSTAVEPTLAASSLPTATPFGDGLASDSPYGNPLHSSTPSSTPQNVFPPVHGDTDDMAMDQTSSSGSDSNSTYIDIDAMGDIELLMNAGIVPSVSKSLKDEISLWWQNIERNRASK